MHGFTWADYDWIGLMIQKICGSGLNRIQFFNLGLDSD